MSDFAHLRLETVKGIATLTIDRPDRLNALGRQTLEELEAAVGGCVADPEVSGVVITGAGDRAFVAGGDIAELAMLEPLQAVQASRLGQRVFGTIERAGKPIVAAVNGFALGGGCELALACHLRVASKNAKFGLPEVKLGTIPGYGGTIRLPRLIGKGRALEIILTGEMIDASEAERIGLVNRVTEPDDLLDTCRDLLISIAANGPVAVSCALESVSNGLEMSQDDGLGFESNLFGLLAGTEDMREGMTAFLAKRKAEFRGR